jgi:polysaccharide pyruvyl transferase WcaK-like protein
MFYIDTKIMMYDLHGYYGFNNLGDELMLESVIVRLLQQKEVKIRCWINKAISKQSLQNYVNKYPSVEFKRYPISFKAFKLFISKSVIRAFWVGGNCFYSSDSSALKWLEKLTKFYKQKEIKFYFLGVGIGTIDSKDKEIFEQIISNSFKIYFREQNSLKKVANFDQLKFGISGDLSYNILDNYKKHCSKDEGSHYLFSGHKYFVNEANIEPIIQSIKSSKKEFKTIDFHGGSSGDVEFNEKINLPNVTPIKALNVEEQIAGITSCKGIISYRLHSIIVADFFNIPNITIKYDPKLSDYHSVMKKAPNSLIEVGQPFDIKDLSVTNDQSVAEVSIALNNKMFDEVF